MSTLPEQFSEATKQAAKANLDAQLAILSTFTRKAIESVEKVVELNLAIAKDSFAKTNETAQKLIAAKDPQEFFNVTAAQTQPSAENVSEYARQLAAIVSNTHTEFAKAAEEHVVDTNRKIVAMVEELAKHAPAGSEHAVALLKSAIGNATASYEQINKSTKQAVEIVEANVNKAVNQISKTPTKTAGRSKK